MGFLSRRAIRRWFRRRLVSAMLALMYFVTAAGIPLPAGTVVRKSGELFPCAASACGCATAEKCWRSCCCHSLAERLAWAREHGVRPPEFAIAEARQAGIDVAWLVAKPGDGVKSLVASCGGHDRCREVKSGTRSCCKAKVSCCESHGDHDAQPTEKKSNHIVGWKALDCQGHSTNWIAAVPTLVSTNVELIWRSPAIAWLGPSLSEKVDCVVSVPTPPPPESA